MDEREQFRQAVDHPVGVGQLGNWGLLAELTGEDGVHAQFFGPTDVVAYAVADEEGLIGRDTQGIEDVAEDGGMGLADAKLGREDSGIDVGSDAQAVDVFVHQARQEVSVGDEADAETEIAQGTQDLEVRLVALQRGHESAVLQLDDPRDQLAGEGNVEGGEGGSEEIENVQLFQLALAVGIDDHLADAAGEGVDQLGRLGEIAGRLGGKQGADLLVDGEERILGGREVNQGMAVIEDDGAESSHPATAA